MKIHAIIAAALLSATAVLAYAQTPKDHESHHPGAPSEGQSSSAPQPQGPPSGGMMGQSGMMGGGPSMMSRMGGMPMMPMMGQMQMMGSGGGMGGMATIDRVEGRIAFLKAELKITEAQSSVWNAFAETLRSNTRTLGELRAAMMQMAASPTLADRLEWQDKWLTARAENTKAIRAAFSELSGKLTDDQKKTADQILAPHLGMIAMMSGMGGGPGGMMGMGHMSPGNSMMKGQMAPPR